MRVEGQPVSRGVVSELVTGNGGPTYASPDRPSTRARRIGSMSLQIASDQLDQQLEQHRRELTGYCYRMLGSPFEAEDAVQETFLRAWRGFDRFEGRAAFRSWLYRIATNVCLDMSSARSRRARP